MALYELWRQTASAGQPFVPKFALVLLILIFTIPKAMIVLIFFMHLKFEKLTIIVLALVPFVLAGIAVLPILADSLALNPGAMNKVEGLKDFSTLKTSESDDHPRGPAADPARDVRISGRPIARTTPAASIVGPCQVTHAFASDECRRSPIGRVGRRTAARRTRGALACDPGRHGVG